MVHPDTILESLVTSCKRHTAVPEQVSYATVELDAEGEHSNVSLPIIEFRIDDIRRSQSRNTDRVGKTIASDGTETGYQYSQWYEMDVVIAVQTAPQTSSSHRELDQLTRKSVYRHDTHGPGVPLPDPDSVGDELNGITWVYTEGTSPTHDFGYSPSIRSRQIRLEVGFEHDLTSADLGIEYDTVEAVEPTVDAED